MVGIELLGRYRIEKALGEGGMGRVFLATDRQLDRRVAVKMIREEMNDPAAHDRFLREARSAASLEHPHACRLYEVGEHEGQPFLVMELLEGRTLADRIAAGPLTVEEAAGLILPLMDAVAALHGAGLIHRDLKPSNVFLTEQGVKLLDFGLARHTRLDTAFTAPALTMAGAVTGTLRYMAPEQVTGDPVDERTDVFALGVLLYEMLTGRNPFDAATNVEWLTAVLKEQPQPLGAPEFRALEPVVARSLQRRPDDRYASVQEMRAALQPAFGVDVGVAVASTPASDSSAAAPASRTPRLRVIVVLPFRSLQADADMVFLENGVPEAVTAALSTWAGLRVLSNREALRFDHTADVATIGRELGVDDVLTGSVLRADHQVRVTAQLVSAADGIVQWSQVRNHTFDNVFALQDAVCAGILDALPLANGD